jgi:hypothetical protein
VIGFPVEVERLMLKSCTVKNSTNCLLESAIYFQ